LILTALVTKSNIHWNQEKQKIEIFKDPITDDGIKKSAKGLLMVEEDGKVLLKDQCTWRRSTRFTSSNLWRWKLLQSNYSNKIREKLNN
jgi:nicotinamide phosphoribosyltransferase